MSHPQLLQKHLTNLLKQTTPAGWVMRGLFLLAGIVFILAPILAYRWIATSFPGFVVEQTLVVSDYNGVNWSGRNEGLAYPQKVISLNGHPLETLREFQSTLAALPLGNDIAVSTILPNGVMQAYSAVRLGTFPTFDLFRLFWLPYAIGLAFLLLGGWVYVERGKAYSGRAFALFCICAALTNALMFDLITTHAGSALWTVAVAFQGGALFRLALVFPEGDRKDKSNRWYFYAPLFVSLALALWGLVVLNNLSRPWDYILAWRFSYLLTGFGILFFLGMMVFRMKTVRSALAHQQIRIILLGSALAFVPVGLWAIAPVFGTIIPWNPALFLPLLLFFPISVGIAVARYRLWDMDLLINRTLVYGFLSFVLGAIYIAIVVMLQSVFERITNQGSPFAAVVSTLAIALLFNPLRKRTQAGVDRRFFRKKYNAEKAIESFAESLRHEVDLDHLTQNLLAVMQDTVHPVQAALCSCVGLSEEEEMPITRDDPLRELLQNSGDGVDLERLNLESPGLERLRQQGIVLVIPVISQGELVGILNLGPHEMDISYSTEDRHLLVALASRVAPALRIVQMVRQERLSVLADQRIGHEMRVARLIQHTLLPKQTPQMPGWQILGHYQPAREVGGDFYDLIELRNGRLGVVIGDATGKGVPAALVMAAARGIVRATALQMVSPGAVLQRANEFLLPTMPPGMFVTCLYAVVDPLDGSVIFANAGHNLPCLTGEGGVFEMQARGMPLGLMPDMEYEENFAAIQPGESVLFYSDGLVEAHNSAREMFGVPRLIEILQDLPSEPDLINALLSSWRRFRGADSDQEDDMTLVVLQRAASLSQPVHRVVLSSVAIPA
jgi:serine phosphatase RsbU (regulator of sigma subunit)